MLIELLTTFFMIGAFTFGGGYAMLPLIQEAVLGKGWIEATQLVDFVAVAESTPGPFAVNIATVNIIINDGNTTPNRAVNAPR